MAVKRKNEFRKRGPKPKEIAAAQKLARRVSKRLFELMEAETINTNASA